MQFSTLVTPFLLAATAAVSASQEPVHQGTTTAVRVVSWDIGFPTVHEHMESDEKPWWTLLCLSGFEVLSKRCRRHYLIHRFSEIASTAPTSPFTGSASIFGLQDVEYTQLHNILDGLDKGWTYVGVTDDDEKDGTSEIEAKPFNPIIYRRDEFDVQHDRVTELGAGQNLLIGYFKHRRSGQSMLVANTHLSELSPVARRNAIDIVLDRVQSLRKITGPHATVLMGNFYESPDQYVYREVAAESGLTDVGKLANITAPGSHEMTYTGWAPQTAQDARQAGIDRSDWVWFGAPGRTSSISRSSVNQYRVWDNFVKGLVVSDHRPVVVDVTLRGD